MKTIFFTILFIFINNITWANPGLVGKLESLSWVPYSDFGDTHRISARLRLGP
ncbi:hypothetical protein ACFLUV_04130 [Elusimicrobiota bacterium]